MEDLLTGGSGGGDGVLTSGKCEFVTGRMEDLTAAGEGVWGSRFAVTNWRLPSVD
jgi:hypothetical protein